MYWWPADSPLGVMEGAVLAQNTSWRNAEKALANLKGRTAEELLNEVSLTESIRPAGFYTQKERSLRRLLLHYILELENTSFPLELRTELLSIKGVGRETADSISLYAFHQRTIPIDSYTLRLLNRYFGSSFSIKDYETIRLQLISIFNQEQLMEFHALIDEHCKMICKKAPDCQACRLRVKCKKNL
jgi:endonuclease-3 related protein